MYVPEYVYRQYMLTCCPHAAPMWYAYSGGDCLIPWFTADTEKELREAIDTAYAELPDPVY